MENQAYLWFLHLLGLRRAPTQLTEAEQNCLRRHVKGKREVVEIGVMFGASTAILRQHMDATGQVTGIDPHPPGRLGFSFQKFICQREIGKIRRGRATLLSKYSYEAAQEFERAIDFLFIDGDHSWKGIERDWRQWSEKIAPGGLILLHDSRSIPGRREHDSVRFTHEVARADSRFEIFDEVDSITVFRRKD